MKKLLLALLCLSLLKPLQAQDLSSFSLLAHYPLTNSSAADATGNYGDINLTNTSFQGDEGIYVNGVYIGNSDPDASLIATPPIDFPDTANIAFSLEFKTLETDFRPIFIAGDYYRWLGVFIINGEIQLMVSDALYTSGHNIQSGQWYNLTLLYSEGETKLWLDGQLIITHNSGALNYHLDIPGDRTISNTHGGFGKAFKGYWRHLKIYSKGGSVASREATTAKLKIFPNPPAENHVQIQLPENFSLHNPFHIHLRDAAGHSIPIHSSLSGQGLISIDLSALPPGTYFLYLNNEQGAWVGKIQHL